MTEAQYRQLLRNSAPRTARCIGAIVAEARLVERCAAAVRRRDRLQRLWEALLAEHRPPDVPHPRRPGDTRALRSDLASALAGTVILAAEGEAATIGARSEEQVRRLRQQTASIARLLEQAGARVRRVHVCLAGPPAGANDPAELGDAAGYRPGSGSETRTAGASRSAEQTCR